MRADKCPCVGMLEPLASLPSQSIGRPGVRARRHIEGRIVDVAAVVERGIPGARPVVAEPVITQQQLRVVELVGHVVEAAPDIQRGLVGHYPHRVTRRAHAIAVAARQRIEAGVGGILLIEVGFELAVAGEDLERVGEVQIDPLREVPVIDHVRDRRLQIVHVARQIGQWDRRQHTSRHRIDHSRRDRVARKSGAHIASGGRIDRRCEGIVDRSHAAVEHRLAEVASPLGLGRDRANDRYRPLIVPLFKRCERENLVALERTADGSAIHAKLGPSEGTVVLPFRPPDSRIGDRIEARIAPEEVAGSSHHIGSGFHVQADDPPKAVAVLRIDAVLRHGDLFDRIH